MSLGKKAGAFAVAGAAVVAVTLVVSANGGLAAKGDKVGKPTERDITKPDDGTEYSVFRNGTFHKIKIKFKRIEVIDENGVTVAERLVEDSADAKAKLAQLPPQDPALVDVAPTDEQIAAARIAVGRKPDGSGAIGDPEPPPTTP